MAGNLVGGLVSVLLVYSWVGSKAPVEYLHWTSPVFATFLTAATRTQDEGNFVTMPLLFLVIFVSVAISMVSQK